MTLRVLHVATLFPTEAAPYRGSFIERQIVALGARADIEPVVFAPDAEGSRASAARERSGLTVVRPGLADGDGRLETLPERMAEAMTPSATDLHRTAPFDIVAAELLWPDGPAAMSLAQALGLPFTVKARGHDLQLAELHPRCLAQARAGARAAAGLLAVSGQLAARVERLAGRPGAVKVHHTGIDLALFRPRDRTALKKQLGISGPLVLSVGNLVPNKGHDVAIEAVASLPGVNLFVAGGGEEAERLQACIDGAGLRDRARLLGFVPHLMLPALMAAADATVLASASEGLANVWIESLASGTPVVTTEVGGAREALDRLEAGRIVAREPAAIAGALSEILASPPDPLKVRAAAERFSWERNAEELESFLRGLMSA